MSIRTWRVAAWAVFVVALALSVADAVFFWLSRDLQAQTSWGSNSLGVGLGFGAMLLAFPVAGVLIATRRPATPIG
jgi:TRAP-type C4-dicarboxylate transport system permease small subunit